MENHPFDRIDPGADEVNVQKQLREVPYCPNCGKELVVTLMEGNYVVYKCVADGKKFKLPANRDTFDKYRQELKNIYNSIDLSLDKWTKDVQRDYLAKLKKISDNYNFTANDPQFDFLKIAGFTRNFQVKYKKWNYGSVRAYTRYKSVKKNLDNCYPLNQDGKNLLEEVERWAKDIDPKPIPKWLKILITCTIASAALATAIVFGFMPKEMTDEATGVSATIDNADFGMFGKWGVKFDVRHLKETSSEYKTASVLLKNESTKFVLYDLSMLSGSNYVQPSSSVRIEAPLPEGYSAANVKVYHVKPEDGSYEIIEKQSVIASQNLVVFEVDHFSLFAIAEHPRNIKFQIDGASIPTQTLMIGHLVSEPETPEREGYSFAGWYNGDKKWSFADDTVPAQDITLVGRWLANEYNLTLDYANGSKETTKKISYDQQYTLEVPERVGYTFLGWYDENSVMFNPSGNWKELSDIKLTARWELEGYKIRFDANGGSVSVTDKNFTYGEKYGDLPTPTRPGFEFLGWYKEKNGNNDDVITPITTIIDAASHTLYARWKAIVYTITVNGIDINNSKWNDSKGNPKYNSETLTTIYFAFGDNNKSQGFYKQEACIEKIPTDYFDQFCVDNAGKINFTFGGLYSGIEITDNGHSYASYTSNIAVLSSDGQLLSNQLSLSEESRAGVLYALIIPKQYTITLDYNTSSKPELSVTNTNATKSVKAYYNEVPETIGQMPESTYYVPSGYSSSNGTGYFNSTGTGLRVYNISGDVTMRCQWSQRYNDYTYIYDKTTLENIGASGKYLVLCDINMNGAVWTSKDSFSGELDGDGHCIYNFTISKTGGSGSAAVAFIKKNAGTIRDLSIGKTGEAKYDSKYSVKYDIGYTESSSASSLMVGGFVGENSGTITGCQLINTFINATLADNDNNEHLYLYVGGIAAYNTGTISRCHVKNSNIDANATCPKESGDDNYAWLGGICAKNSATIKQCTVQVTTLDLDVRGDGFWKIGSDNKAYPWGALGGIVGEQINGSITSCSVTDVTRNIYASSGKYTSPTTYNESVCGLKSSGTVL